LRSGGNGKARRIQLKCNSLTHVDVTEELYEASRAGAQILPPSGAWDRVSPKKSERRRLAQSVFMRRRERARRLARSH
jgi:hypothetical protein